MDGVEAKGERAGALYNPLAQRVYEAKVSEAQTKKVCGLTRTENVSKVYSIPAARMPRH